MRNKQRIKHCPFCGGKAGLFEDYTSWWVVQCRGCGATTLKQPNAKSALWKWNMRIHFHDNTNSHKHSRSS